MKSKSYALWLAMLLFLVTIFQPRVCAQGVVPESDSQDGAWIIPPPVRGAFWDNVYCSEGVAQSLRYTKLIDLTGYGAKSIEGKLHFSLTPYPMEAIVYDVRDLKNEPQNPTLQNRVKVRSGITSYTYPVPYSSEDFVDPKFNELARQAAANNGNTTELFNYALLHEWGRVQSSDHGQTASVGKFYRYMFNNDEEYQQALKDYVVHWDGDPETQIAGWKCSQERENMSSDVDCTLGSYEEGCQNLHEYEPFRDGTFDYIGTFTLHANQAVTYRMAMITRPIALSKTYDENNNILSIEKPLLPSARAWDFLQKHPYDSNYETDDQGIYNHMIYRYLLTENQATGMELEGDSTSIIVDADPGSDSIYMFRTEGEADKFYRDRITLLETEYGGELNPSLGGGSDLFHKSLPTFSFGDSPAIQLRNSLPKTSVSVRKVWKDNDNRMGKRPQNVEVELIADGVRTGQRLVLNEENKWQVSFENLNLYKYQSNTSTGKVERDLAQYSIVETNVPHYESHVDLIDKKLNMTTLLLSNTYTDEVISLDVDKRWDDAENKAQKRPSEITINLLKNGRVFDIRKISEADGWKTRFENLARFDEKGKEIQYRIEEVPVTGYEASYDGFHITNKFKPVEPTKPSETCPPCNPSETAPSQPCQPISPCEPHDSTKWPLTSQQKTPSYLVTNPTESKATTSVTGTKAPQSAGMLPVTADESWMNVLYAAVLLALAGLVTGLRYEMKRRKEN